MQWFCLEIGLNWDFRKDKASIKFVSYISPKIMFRYLMAYALYIIWKGQIAVTTIACRPRDFIYVNMLVSQQSTHLRIYGIAQKKQPNKAVSGGAEPENITFWLRKQFIWPCNVENLIVLCNFRIPTLKAQVIFIKCFKL